MKIRYEFNLNLLIRAKNPQFWIQIGLSVFAPILAYYGISGTEIDTWPKLYELLKGALSNPFIVFSALVGIYNAITDPTTPGLSDSSRAMGYDSMRDHRYSNNQSNDQSVG